MKQLETHITPTNKHDSSDLSLDLADLVNANVSFESEAESGSVNDVTSESENETVENNSDSDHEAGDALFYPSLSNQRHQKVLDILKEENSQSVLDLGCNSLKFLSLGKTHKTTGTSLKIYLGIEVLSEKDEDSWLSDQRKQNDADFIIHFLSDFVELRFATFI